MVTSRTERKNEAFLPDKKYPNEGLISADIFPGDEEFINKLLQGEESQLGEYRVIEYLGRPSDRNWPKARSNKIQITWRIRCSCGFEKDISHDSLNTLRSRIKLKKTKPHCECPIHDEEERYKIDDQYDLLTIIGYKKCTREEAGRKKDNNIRRWYLMCTCKCGEKTAENPYLIPTNEIESSLLKGLGFGCGCKTANLTKTHGKSETIECKRLYRLKSKAKRKKLEFDLEMDDCIAPQRCPVFDIALIPSNKELSDNPPQNAPHQDRLIPSKGYTKDNINFISAKANTMKSNATVAQIRKVADWLEKKLIEIDQL